MEHARIAQDFKLNKAKTESVCKTWQQLDELARQERRRIKKSADAIRNGAVQIPDDEEVAAPIISMVSDNAVAKSAVDAPQSAKKGGRRTTGAASSFVFNIDDEDPDTGNKKTAAADISVPYICWGLSQKVQLAGVRGSAWAV